MDAILLALTAITNLLLIESGGWRQRSCLAETLSGFFVAEVGDGEGAGCACGSVDGLGIGGDGGCCGRALVNSERPVSPEAVIQIVRNPLK